MSSLEHSEELQVLVLLESTSSLVVNVPVSIIVLIEVGFAGPLDFMSPCFSTSPVADEIFITRVNKDIVISLEEICDLWSEIKHPVAEESGVDNLVAFSP
jgi:hypothetical protein